ncbi:MAG: hypothetical protein JSS66_07145 [Armatimonadetes bacterium]|nr:hypothetical protein [Armatimonadota bacterium]
MLILFGIEVALWVVVLLALGIIGLFVSVEKESPVGATLIVIGAVALLQLTQTVNFAPMFADWRTVTMYTALYIGVGLAWAIVKWKFWVDRWARERRQAIQQARKTFLQHMKIEGDTVPDEMRDDWESWVQGRAIAGPVPYIDKPIRLNEDDVNVVQNKGRLTLWGIYWPFSMTWTLVDDPLRRFYEWVLTVVIGGPLQWFGTKAHASVQAELKK